MKLVSFLIVSVFLLLSCQTTSKKQSSDVDPVIWYDLAWLDNVTIPAKNVYVSVTSEPGVPESLFADASASVLKIEKWFQDNGYTISQSRAKADFWVDLSVRMLEPLKSTDKTITTDVIQTETRTKAINGTNDIVVQRAVADKDGRLYDYSFLGGVQESGKRLAPTFYTSAKSGSISALSERLRAEIPNWIAELTKIQVAAKAPSKKINSSQGPGCTPRFGFEFVRRIDGEQNAYVVHKVLKKSAADKAGVKVGDQIIGVDSQSYDEFLKNSKSMLKVYDEKIEVPLKLRRGDKEIRSKIRAAVSCEN